jgi:hypothetical protein
MGWCIGCDFHRWVVVCLYLNDNWDPHGKIGCIYRNLSLSDVWSCMLEYAISVLLCCRH